MPVSPHRPPLANLRRLFVLRNLVIAGQLGLIAWAHFGLSVQLALAPISTALAALALLNVWTWRRLQWQCPLGEWEFFAQLAADVAILSALFYFSGGPTNPFVSFYLLPVAIAAAVAPARTAWCVAAFGVAAYTSLMFKFVPLQLQGAPFDGFDLHVFGMWLNFVLSAGLIAFFVSRMAASLRERDRELGEAREKSLRDQQVMALGALAAGAAHEIGTPLSTIATLTRELEREAGESRQSEDLRVIRRQVERCKKILTDLLASAGQARLEACGREAADRFLASVVEDWRGMRPRHAIQWRWQGVAPRIVNQPALKQTLLSLLNNAADVSETVEVEAFADSGSLIVEVRDRGPGLTRETARRAGEAFFTTKGGHGIGLFLARAAVERMGGTVALSNRDGGGAVSQVSLPLAALGAVS